MIYLKGPIPYSLVGHPYMKAPPRPLTYVARTSLSLECAIDSVIREPPNLLGWGDG